MSEIKCRDRHDLDCDTRVLNDVGDGWCCVLCGREIIVRSTLKPYIEYEVHQPLDPLPPDREIPMDWDESND